MPSRTSSVSNAYPQCRNTEGLLRKVGTRGSVAGAQSTGGHAGTLRAVRVGTWRKLRLRAPKLHAADYVKRAVQMEAHMAPPSSSTTSHTLSDDNLLCPEVRRICNVTPGACLPTTHVKINE
ncbi:hypothetical protein BU25DRAFT_195842 [Macroventuria anomochaeta]|uniref:Uncharacterized protein n=1 Tax=Macroventuria anomochaeta TaxID=301207 RepID=A0ACB6SC06_9PLEO|nr:uncharacterized protein BU25DRAFT_195842 [Macroventuria anomochaeta]KAF2631741.1 hypothetical protein BU25DRAFT_195842 [Macroventuria anomochaeta]